ncbi:MAG: sulfatase-like hydrolase/transferase [bacterium]|nr:sulfatase-like hydrolase/transferase [bacterium]
MAILTATLFSALLVAVVSAAPQEPAAAQVVWKNARELTIEGQGWSEMRAAWDRLPRRAEPLVREQVWKLSRNSAGIAVRFSTDATSIAARWSLSSPELGMPHMPATGVSGLDLYVRHAGAWRWLATPRPTQQSNEATLVSGLDPGEREYLLYLPLYNGVTRLEVGVPDGTVLRPGAERPADAARPIVFYGTSITQGACASRPGLAHVAQLGRRLDRPTINLGFSGNGEMELELARLVGEIDAEVYVIDCLPNMNADQVRERTVPFVRALRAARPGVPILLVEDRSFQNAYLREGLRAAHLARRAALREAFVALQEEGDSELAYLAGDGLLGSDSEGTVEGSHPNDLGFTRQADAFEPVLAKLVGRAPAAAPDRDPAPEPDAPDAPASVPNVVFFLVDDLGWKDVGCYGSELHETPNIDRLAAAGARFTAAYANAPNCAPTRAAILSGQYAPRTGIYTVNSSARGQAQNRKLVPIENKRTLDADVLTLPEVLDRAGYVSAAIGKWHLGDDPCAQGFDVNVGGDERGSPHKGYLVPYGNPNLSDGPEGEYLTDRLTDEALAFLDSASKEGNPFFLYLSHYAVHTPVQGRPDLVEKYREKRMDGWGGRPDYGAMVEAVDDSLGRVVGKLDELGLAENTIVIFFSDNGGHGRFTSMAPLRGSKGMLYEGGVREPLIVRWPGRARAGATIDAPVISVDFFPTLLEAAGLAAPDGKVLDGVSLLPLLTGAGALDRDAIYWHFPAYLESYTVREAPWRTTPVGAIRSGKYKLLEFFEDGRLELYDLEADPGENADLAQLEPERTAELAARLALWRVEVDAPIPVDLEPDYVAPDDDGR